jgi:hypothetical protein
MSDYKKIILKNSPVPGAVPLEDFLDFGELALNYADKKLYYKELSGGIVVHETPYLDTTGSQNSVVKRNGDGSGVFNGVISNISDPDLYALDISSSASTAARVVALNTQTAINAAAASGIGANISSVSGIGAIISSGSSTAAIISSNSSTYHAEFGNSTTNNSSAIERIRGAFVWFYNTFKGRLQTANITADRNWTLPDTSGTILLDSSRRSGKTIYVDGGNGTDNRTGLSAYSAPFVTISAAVAASTAGELVYVSAGTYTITEQINLNSKGHLYFAPGTIVAVSTGITAFEYSQNSATVYIYGKADFVTAGTGAIASITAGNANTLVALECNSITSSNGTGTLFSVNAGSLFVDARTIRATAATVFNITATGIVSARITFVYCGRYLNANATTTSHINSTIWTLETNNTTAGMAITSIGGANFNITNYYHLGVGVVCSWTQDAQIEGISFIDTTWDSKNNLSHISATTTAASMTNKKIFLKGSNTFTGITNTTASITSTQSLNVFVQTSYATTAPHTNITFKVGTFTVDIDANEFK